MLAQMYASEQRPIGFDQKDMMKTNRGLHQKGRNRAAICEGECHDRYCRMPRRGLKKPEEKCSHYLGKEEDHLRFSEELFL